MREPGVGPGSPRWQRDILTTILLAHVLLILKEFYKVYYNKMVPTGIEPAIFSV